MVVVLYCELCGRPVKRAFKVKIEGAVLVVCESCAERGEVIAEVAPVSPRGGKRTSFADVVEDFAERIRGARKRLGMDLRQLSKETGIPVRVLRAMEEGRVMPDEEQAERLERALGIRLREEEERFEGSSSSFTLTLGDVVRVR